MYNVMRGATNRQAELTTVGVSPPHLRPSHLLVGEKKIKKYHFRG